MYQEYLLTSRENTDQIRTLDLLKVVFGHLKKDD